MNGIGVMLEFFDNFSNGISNAINSANNLGSSFDNVSNAANIDLNTSQFDSLANSASNVATQIDNWTEKVGSYNKEALEAVYSTEELVQMGFKTQDALQGIAEVGKEIPPPLDNATKEQDKLNRSINVGSGNMNGFVSKVGNLLKTYLGFQAAKKGITETIGGAMELQQQLFTMQGIMGNSDVATAYFDNLQKKANESVFSFEDFAQNARNFMQFTKNTDTLDSLANLSERLALIDPTQGLQGAGFALKEMMSGDGVSLKDRFGFGKADIEILKASQDMNDFISKFDILLSKKGFTEDMLAQYNQSAAAQFDNLESNIATGLAQAGNNALEALNPLITKINQAFSNGAFDGFFNSLSNGLTIFAYAVVNTVGVISNIGQAIQDNWGIIGPVIEIAVGAYLGFNAVALITNAILGAQALAHGIAGAAEMLHTGYTMAETVAQHGLNAALLACPLTWIVIAIFAVIAAITAWSIHTNGLQATWLIFTNILITAWDSLKLSAVLMAFSVMNAWDSMTIGIYSASVGIQNFLGNMKANGLMIIQNFVNGAIDLINDLINTVNNIPGVSIDTIQHVTFGAEAMAENQAEQAARNNDLAAYRSQKEANKLARDTYFNNMFNEAKSNFQDRMANIEAAKQAHANGTDTFSLTDLFKKGLGTDLDSWNAMQGPGDLSNVNDSGANKKLSGISDKIDISNETMKMLADSSEEKSISNFITLSPSITFGDTHVKEEADINKIISKIETYMDEEIANSAEGVYSY